MAIWTLLEVAIGLTFVYVLLSVLCSGLNEWLAQTTGRRGRFLREGLRNMLSDRWFYLRLMNHPLVAAHRRDAAGNPQNPSYLPSEIVAEALLDVLLAKAEYLEKRVSGIASYKRPLNPEEARKAAEICGQHGYSVGRAVLPLLDQAGDDMVAARKAIAGWYDNSMERVTGWYKRSSRNFLFLIGAGMAVLLNADSIEIARALMAPDPLREAIVEQAEGAARTGTIAGVQFMKDDNPVSLSPQDIKILVDAGEGLEVAGLPIGFSCMAPVFESQGGKHVTIGETIADCAKAGAAASSGQWTFKILGWLITALALTLGASFWFDLLNRLIDIRGAGGKPPPSQGNNGKAPGSAAA